MVNTFIGSAKISGTKRLANIYKNNNSKKRNGLIVYVKNYAGDFVEIFNVNILEFYFSN